MIIIVKMSWVVNKDFDWHDILFYWTVVQETADYRPEHEEGWEIKATGFNEIYKDKWILFKNGVAYSQQCEWFIADADSGQEYNCDDITQAWNCIKVKEKEGDCFVYYLPLLEDSFPVIDYQPRCKMRP